MNSDVGALYIESVNEVTNLHATRAGIGLDARIPTSIWVALICLLILGMIALGYHCAIADSRRSRVVAVLAISFSLVVTLIAALDHPGGNSRASISAAVDKRLGGDAGVGGLVLSSGIYGYPLDSSFAALSKYTVSSCLDPE